jgi:hypothetical protein
MTEEELKEALEPQNLTLIMADEMKDVAFWPLSLTITDKHYELNGIWYSNLLGDLMGDTFGQPLREVIKIKKEDLKKWKQANPEAIQN